MSEKCFKLLQVDVCLDLLKKPHEIAEQFNNICREYNSEVIGIRGFWLDECRKFNVIALIAHGNKYIDFESVQALLEPSKDAIVAHDIIYSGNKLSLCFYSKQRHIFSIDENTYISKTLNSYFKETEKKLLIN